jgi:glutamate synthase (NADPH/NADH)
MSCGSRWHKVLCQVKGVKVSLPIAHTCCSIANIGLISPPPHHNIDSIEGLKQLIYNLKGSNPRACVSVKLVSGVGICIIACGATKAKADHILTSSHDGGTSVSKWASAMLGLAETCQTRVLNHPCSWVVVQTDGQIHTGHDIVIACLLSSYLLTECLLSQYCHSRSSTLCQVIAGQPKWVINLSLKSWYPSGVRVQM